MEVTVKSDRRDTALFFGPRLIATRVADRNASASVIQAREAR